MNVTPNLTNFLCFISFSGWCVDPWALFRGGWLGQKECVPHRSGAHATCERYAHNSFQACWKQEEEWKRYLRWFTFSKTQELFDKKRLRNVPADRLCISYTFTFYISGGLIKPGAGSWLEYGDRMFQRIFLTLEKKESSFLSHVPYYRKFRRTLFSRI